MGMALSLTLHSDFWPPCGEGQEHVSQEKIIKKNKQKGKRSLSRVTPSTVLVPLTLKSGQNKVSLKHFLRAQVKWGFWSGTLHVSTVYQYTIICTVALLLYMSCQKNYSNTKLKSNPNRKISLKKFVQYFNRNRLQSENGKFLLSCSCLQL